MAKSEKKKTNRQIIKPKKQHTILKYEQHEGDLTLSEPAPLVNIIQGTTNVHYEDSTDVQRLCNSSNQV